MIVIKKLDFNFKEWFKYWYNEPINWKPSEILNYNKVLLWGISVLSHLYDAEYSIHVTYNDILKLISGKLVFCNDIFVNISYIKDKEAIGGATIIHK